MAVSVVLEYKGPALPLLVSLQCLSWFFAPTAPWCSCLPLVRMHPSTRSQVHQKNQACLHGNRETAEKWQLNAAAPHLISTLALTEQIMGNNTPLCCGEMKCFSRRLSCCRDLFVTVPAEISLPFCLSLSLILSSFSPSFPFLPVFSTCPFCFPLINCIPSFLLFSFPHVFSLLLSLSCSLDLFFLVLKIAVSEAQGFCETPSILHLSDFPCTSLFFSLLSVCTCPYDSSEDEVFWLSLLPPYFCVLGFNLASRTQCNGSF